MEETLRSHLSWCTHRYLAVENGEDKMGKTNVSEKDITGPTIRS